jgi:hypothetical protein
MSSLPHFRLPDLVAQWPWPRQLNRHYEEAKSESEKWLRAFEALDANSQRAFDFCDFRKYCLFRCHQFLVVDRAPSTSELSWISVT